jgi:hypothetical protein
MQGGQGITLAVAAGMRGCRMGHTALFLLPSTFDLEKKKGHPDMNTGMTHYDLHCDMAQLLLYTTHFLTHY